MSNKKNSDRINRRNVIRSIGGLSAGFLITDTVAAEKATESDMEKALSAKETQQLAENIGYDQAHYKENISDTDIINSEINDEAYTAIKIPADEGDLIVGEYDSVTIAQFFFDSENTTAVRSRINQMDGFADGLQYQPDTNPTLVSTAEGVTYYREVTEEEERDLETLLGAEYDIDRSFVSTDSNITKYVVQTNEGEVEINEARTDIISKKPHQGDQDQVGILSNCSDGTFLSCGSDAVTVLTSCGSVSGSACVYSAAGGPAAFIAGCGAALLLICGPAVGLATVSGACADAVNCV